MKCTQWPFRPIHITNDGEESRERPDLKKLIGPGIISNNYLAAFQSEICSSIDRATTLIEFSPSGDPIRTDSPILAYKIHPVCRLLREFDPCVSSPKEFNEGCQCKDSDAHHALLFFGLTRAQVDAQLPAKVIELREQFFRIYDSEPICDFQRLRIDNRSFLVYDCHLLGMREGVFPIYVEDRVIGVLFAGQIILQDKVDFIRDRMRTLVDRIPAHVMTHPGKKCQRISPKALVKEMLKANSKWLKENQKYVLTEPDYQAHLEKTCQEISKLENRLEEELNHQRRQFVSKHIGIHMEQFRRKLPPDPVNGREALDALWKDLKEELSGLVRDFSFKYMAVFGIPKPTAERNPQLPIVAVTDENLPESMIDSGHKTIYLDLKALPEVNNGSVYTPGENGDVLQKCLGGISYSALGDFYLVPIGVPLHPLSSIAILVGCTKENPSNATENQAYGELEKALRSFYTLVVSSLSAILAASSEQEIDSRMRILRHEVGQLTAGLDALRVCYLRNPEDIRRLTDSKVSDICRDFEAYLRHVHLIFGSVKYSIDELPKIDPEHFLAFRELLYKWKDIYRLEAKKKGLEFCLPQTGVDDPERPPVYGDRNLLEQLLYNLVSNAVKYCHRGTRIHLDCSIQSSDRLASHMLTVASYGVHMPEDERLYELFQRGDNAPDEGLGIGLWLAKKIALAHGGKIQHVSEHVSKFNLPLMEPYLRLPKKFIDLAIGDKVQEELDRLKLSGEFEMAITPRSSQNRYNPFLRTVLNSIQLPTYRVEIRVAIPRMPEGRKSK